MIDIKANLQHIQDQIKKTAIKAGRNPAEIRLVAVSKKMPSSAIKKALNAGQVIFGENYLQDAQKKIKELGAGPEWHFIGHIQSNKAKNIADLFHVVHTVDRLKLAKALDKEAGKIGKKLSVLVQINIGKEMQKSGVMPEQAENLLEVLQKFQHLQVKGLMTIPPYKNDPEDVRPFFRAMRNLKEQFAGKGYFSNTSLIELSMGMSHDYQVAIEEGATLVRIGTAIFGPRP
jgi:pyridoxal phosphate enzyme (YggS family)